MKFGLQIAAAYALAALILFTSTAAIAAGGAKSQYPIGELLLLQGDAFYVGANGKLPIRQGDPIYMNTTLETAADARALILFVDNTEITLSEDAQLEIDEYVFDPYDAAENKGEFTISGAFAWTSGLLSKRTNPDVKINTSVGSIGIRGTKFWGGTLGGNYGVYVFEGLVNYTTETGTVSLNPDEGVFTKDKTTAFDTAAWPAKTVKDAIKTVSFSADTNVEYRLNNARKANVSKQHDYRAHMFPYKSNPLQPRLKAKESDFFSEEFEQLRGQ